MHCYRITLGLFAILSTASASPLVRSAVKPHLATRDDQNIVNMCVDFNGGGNCANVGVPLDPLGFTPFEVNSGELCNLLGGCPSSVQIISPEGLTCTFSDSNSIIGGLNGDVIGPINSASGRVNLDKGNLNDNLKFLSCNIGGT